MVPRRIWQAMAASALVAIGNVSALGAATQNAGWPQFDGPRRDNISTETGLSKQWPEGGPPLLWQAKDIVRGWSSVAIADGVIYTTGKLGKELVITALDLSGKRLWQAKNGLATTKSPAGARATPTIVDGKLYHMNGNGEIACLDAKTGKPLWAVKLLERFGGANIMWAFSESLLVDGDKLICCPGGKKVSMAALNKDTGETVWTCTGADEVPAYTSPIVFTHKGLRQIVTTLASSAVGVAAETGKLLWKYPHKVAGGANCATPIHDNGRVFLFGNWGRGATMLKLNVEGDTCTVTEGWRTKDLDNLLGGLVLVDGYLYGQADGNHKKRHWACLEASTGKTMYAAKGMLRMSGSVTYADGMLYLLGDFRKVALVPATPKAFEVVSQFELPKQGRGSTWAHPVVCGGRLYIRHGQFLYAYDVRAGAETGGKASPPQTTGTGK